MIILPLTILLPTLPTQLLLQLLPNLPLCIPPSILTCVCVMATLVFYYRRKTVALPNGPYGVVLVTTVRRAAAAACRAYRLIYLYCNERRYAVTH